MERKEGEAPPLLRTYSKYSYLDSERIPSPSSPEDLVNAAKQAGYNAIALTDRNVYGLTKFYRACQEAGIKPIAGVELPLLVDPFERHVPTIFLPEDNNGLLSVFNLVSKVHRDRNSLTLNDLELTQEFPAARVYKLVRGNSRFIPELIKQPDFFYAADNQDVPDHIRPNAVAAPPFAMATTRDLPIFGFLANTAPNSSQWLQYRQGFVLKTPEELRTLYRECPGLLRKAKEIADTINVDLPDPIQVRAKSVPEGVSSFNYLKHLVYEELYKRPSNTDVQERADYELSYIEQLGYSDYLLICREIALYCMSRDITYVVAGSGNNSVVMSLLGVTSIQHPEELMFERFINLHRGTPDFDIQVPPEFISELNRYLLDLYPVMSISSFTTIKHRRAVQLAKEHNIPITENLISQVANASIPEGIRVHPSGKVLPLPWAESESAGNHLLQIDKTDVDILNLYKFDLLTSNAPRHITDTLRSIGEVTIPLDDERALNRLFNGETIGITHCESPHMQQLLKTLGSHIEHPSLKEIDYALSMARLAKSARNIFYYYPFDEAVYRQFPSLYRILSHTNGAIIYQEQILRIAEEVAGYTDVDSNNLRKMLSEQVPYEAKKAKIDELIGRLSQTNIPYVYLLPITVSLAAYTSYAFVEGHSESLAASAYMQSYLSEHYPEYYLSSVLTQLTTDPNTLLYIPQVYLNEVYRRGLQFHFPPLDEMGQFPYVVGNKIIPGIKLFGNSRQTPSLYSRFLRILKTEDEKAILDYQRNVFRKIFTQDAASLLPRYSENTVYGQVVLFSPRPEFDTVYVTLDNGRLVHLSIKPYVLKERKINKGSVWKTQVEGNNILDLEIIAPH